MGGVRGLTLLLALLFATLLWWALLLCTLAKLIGWLPAALAMAVLLALGVMVAGCVIQKPK